MNQATISAIVAAVVGALGTYLLAVRKFSGKIKTTEADKLWEQVGKFQEVIIKERDQFSTRTAKLEERVAKLEGEKNDLVRKNIELENQAEQQARQVSFLEATVESQKVVIAQLTTELEEERDVRRNGGHG